jgi:hypothetical protein
MFHLYNYAGPLGDDSPSDRSPKGKSPKGDPLGISPFNPPYGWLAPNAMMFMPPWYPSIVIWLEQTSKLPSKKLQYPTYIKDIALNVHIRVFKNAIKENMEIVQFDIINLFGFTLKNNILKWGKNFVQDKTTQIAHLRSWNRCFTNVSTL